VNNLKVKRVKYPIHPAGEDTTAFIAALPARLTKQKNSNEEHCLIFLLRQTSRQDHSESCPTDYFSIIPEQKFFNATNTAIAKLYQTNIWKRQLTEED